MDLHVDIRQCIVTWALTLGAPRCVALSMRPRTDPIRQIQCIGDAASQIMQSMGGTGVMN